MPQCDAGGAKSRRRRDAAVRSVRVDVVPCVDGIASSRGAPPAATQSRSASKPTSSGSDHGVLAALAEQRAAHAVGGDLLGQPGVRHDREAHADEVAGRVREGAQLVEAVRGARGAQLVDDASRRRPGCRALRVDDQRAHFGDRAAERRELGAADDSVAPGPRRRSDGVDRQLAERARQQMSFREVRRSAHGCAGVVCDCRRCTARRLSASIPAPGSPSVSISTGSRVHRRRIAKHSSRRQRLRRSRASVIMSGGSSRTTVSAVRLTSTPRVQRGLSTTGAASTRELEAPHQARRRGRPSTIRMLARERAQPPLEERADALTCVEQAAVRSARSRTNSAARQASRLPP